MIYRKQDTEQESLRTIRLPGNISVLVRRCRTTKGLVTYEGAINRDQLQVTRGNYPADQFTIMGQAEIVFSSNNPDDNNHEGWGCTLIGADGILIRTSGADGYTPLTGFMACLRLAVGKIRTREFADA